MDELKLKFWDLIWTFTPDATDTFDNHLWPKIEQLIEAEKAKAVSEYKASMNVQYTPEQIGQRGPDDFNFNILIPKKIL